MCLRTFLPVVACAGWLIGCRSSQPITIENYAQANKLVRQYVRHYNTRQRKPWLGPIPSTAIHLRRSHPDQEAVLYGHIKELLNNGKEELLLGTFVVVDGKIAARADATGKYTVVLPLGRHQVRAGSVNFLASEAPPLQVEQGDSICLNFRLLPELRPILCQ